MAIFNGEPRVSLEDIKRSIDRMVLEKKVSKSATVLWAANVVEGDEYNRKWGVMPASVLLGLEWEEDGVYHNGTLRIEPPIESKMVS